MIGDVCGPLPPATDTLVRRPSCWFQPGSTLTVVVFSGVNQEIEEICLSIALLFKKVKNHYKK